MSNKIIPEHIDPYRFAEQNLAIDGTVKIADLPRLNSLVYPQNTVEVNFQFGIDEQGITYLKGLLETEVKLQCQRCMEPFNYGIMSSFALGIVNSLDEANALPENYEPAIAQERSLSLIDLIEDELILNLPIIPKHTLEACKVKLPFVDKNWSQDEKKNPFQVLESLKSKQK